MALEEYKGVFVFAQQVDNQISNIAYELIGKGKDLAADLQTEVTAVLVGSDVKGLADKLAEYGADRVIVVDDPELKRREQENRDYMLRLETRALMLNFEMEAGLEGSAETPEYMHGGWENPCCQRKNPYRSYRRLYTAGYR